MPSASQSTQREIRHRHIRTLLRNGTVHSQTELQAQLAKVGLKAEQATLSRDLHALGVVKGPDGYLLPDAPRMPGSARLELVQLVRHYLAAVDCAGQIVVLRTGPGRAQPLGLALDETRLPGVLGTIAGDDTIFVAMSSVRAAERLARGIRAVADGADAEVLDRSTVSDDRAANRKAGTP